MAYRLTYTDRFRASYKIFSATEKKQLMKKLALLAENPMHPYLRTKRIRGANGLFECSVNAVL
jgi:mRNA-degrading endonuclease RelE of RelBE toxin-antitoxin system